MNQQTLLRRRIRCLLAFFIIPLFVSGLTAFPLRWELDTLAGLLGIHAGASSESLDGLAVVDRHGARGWPHNHFAMVFDDRLPGRSSRPPRKLSRLTQE